MHKAYSVVGSLKFSIADYCVFALMLILSTAVGIYFALKKPKEPKEPAADGKKPADFGGSEKMAEYLLGGRNMKVFPVAMSLIASYVSGLTILGTTTEIYYYGTQYWMIIVAIALMGVVVAFVYLPIFSALQVGSSYEYLELRFTSVMRSAASILFVMDEIFFLPVVLYIPALAFSQVTDVNLHIVSVTICVVCVLYTVFGGIKVVVHTDAWQILIMFISVFVVVILGIVVAGGPGNIFRAAEAGERLNFFDVSPSMYQRHTLWGVLIGGFFYWTSFNAVHQTMVQQYMTLPSLKKGQLAVLLFTIGIILFLSFCIFTGLLVYHYYQDCDPLTAGLIKHDDQLLSMYIMQTVGHLQGIPGLFTAGVFGAALSSLAVVLNATSLVLLEDIIKGCFRIKLTERQSTIIVKSSIVILGLISVALVFVLEKLSGILSVAVAITSIAAGSTFGVFTLGMMIPWSNTKGALGGAIAGCLMSGWITFGKQISYAAGYFPNDKLPISVSECPGNVTMPEIEYKDDAFPLHRISFIWINPIGVLTTVLVGTILSFATGATKLKTLDADLVSPILHRWLPPESIALSKAAQRNQAKQ